MIALGQIVPDLQFLRADESSCSLSEFAGKKLVVIFLRHLA
jgi:peroxiredoxin